MQTKTRGIWSHLEKGLRAAVLEQSLENIFTGPCHHILLEEDNVSIWCNTLGTESKNQNGKGLTLVQALEGQEIGLFWLVDSYWGYLISHWLAILLFMVGFSTKPNANTVVCHWIMIWCSFLLTKIDVVMYIVQDRWGLLADENRESLGAVNCVILDQELL